MTWLTGKFKNVISLRWPADDPMVELSKTSYFAYTLSPSILDDQILYTIVRRRDPPTSFLYLARVYEAIANNQQQITFTVCATLPYIVHGVALLPQRAGFTSLTYDREEFTITLRVHDWDGSIVRETSTHAKAAYGRLVLQEDLVGVCISTGEETDEEIDFEGFPYASARVDYNFVNPTVIQYDAPYGDSIFVWNWKTGTSRHTKIPQDQDFPLRHQGNFEFVDQNFIAIGGTLSSAHGNPSALLKTFSLSHEFTRTFSHNMNFEMDDDLDVVALSSSSKPEDILVNYHHSGSRLTVFKKDLLKDTIESQPDSDDPAGLHMVTSHKAHFRTINGMVNPYLPAVCGNRILASFTIGDDIALSDFTFDQHGRSVLFIYDFDQQRCTSLLNSTDRSLLEEQIRVDNKDAQVAVVQRNYYCSIEDDEDMEYPMFKAPQEWRDYLQNRWKIEEKRREGDSDPLILEFDEGPSETKESPRLVFTRSLVWLPPDEYRSMNHLNLALSTSGIVYVPDPGKEGHIFVFEN